MREWPNVIWIFFFHPYHFIVIICKHSTILYYVVIQLLISQRRLLSVDLGWQCCICKSYKTNTITFEDNCLTFYINSWCIIHNFYSKPSTHTHTLNTITVEKTVYWLKLTTCTHSIVCTSYCDLPLLYTHYYCNQGVLLVATQ